MKYIRKNYQTECSLLSLFHEQEKSQKKGILYKGVMFNSCKKAVKRTYIFYLWNKIIIKLLFEEYGYSSATLKCFISKREHLETKNTFKIV